VRYGRTKHRRQALASVILSGYSSIIETAMDVRFYHPADRAREKQADRDEQQIASGERSPEHVHRENAMFAFLPLSVQFPSEEL
jgi:hypothetical protein